MMESPHPSGDRPQLVKWARTSLPAANEVKAKWFSEGTQSPSASVSALMFGCGFCFILVHPQRKTRRDVRGHGLF